MDSGGPWTGVHDDICQVLAYILELRCPHGGVVFPVDWTALPKTPRLPSGAGPRDRLNLPPFQFWRFPFAVPGEVSDYGVFRRLMDQEAERLGRQITGLLLQPCRPLAVYFGGR